MQCDSESCMQKGYNFLTIVLLKLSSLSTLLLPNLQNGKFFTILYKLTFMISKTVISQLVDGSLIT